jgi:hypothetical protein
MERLCENICFQLAACLYIRQFRIFDCSRLISDKPGHFYYIDLYLFSDWFRESILPGNQKCKKKNSSMDDVEGWLLSFKMMLSAQFLQS